MQPSILQTMQMQPASAVYPFQSPWSWRESCQRQPRFQISWRCTTKRGWPLPWRSWGFFRRDDSPGICMLVFLFTYSKGFTCRSWCESVPEPHGEYPLASNMISFVRTAWGTEPHVSSLATSGRWYYWEDFGSMPEQYHIWIIPKGELISSSQPPSHKFLTNICKRLSDAQWTPPRCGALCLWMQRIRKAVRASARRCITITSLLSFANLKADDTTM